MPISDDAQVIRSAGAMSVATLLSRILGLVREQVFAYFFGAGNSTDAFQIAFRIPNLLRDLFAEGAMSQSLVPTFIRVRKEEGLARGWQVARRVFCSLFVIVAVISVIGILFADPIVSFYASAYRAVPGKFELTVRLTRILFPFFPLVALAAAFMGILNSLGLFFLPAFASALFNAGSLITGILLSFWMGARGDDPIVGMAWGVVIGGGVQAFCQWPSLLKRGVTTHCEAKIAITRDPALGKMLKLMVPGTLGLAATQINILVNSILATSLGIGAVSWLGYAFRLMQFPIGIFGVSLAQATLPQVSRHWVNDDPQAFAQSVMKSLKNVFAINSPAAAGLAFLSVPIIQVIFEHGKFTPADTHATALALMGYSIGLVAYSAVKVLVPVFYAIGNTRIPVISSMLTVAMSLVLSVFLSRQIGFVGLAIATSLTAFFNAGFLWIVLRRILGQKGVLLSVAELFRAFFAHSAISIAMGILCLLTWNFWEKIMIGPTYDLGQHGLSIFWMRLGGLGIVVALGILLVLLASKIFNLEETKSVVDVIARKLRWRSK